MENVGVGELICHQCRAISIFFRSFLSFIELENPPFWTIPAQNARLPEQEPITVGRSNTFCEIITASLFLFPAVRKLYTPSACIFIQSASGTYAVWASRRPSPAHGVCLGFWGGCTRRLPRDPPATDDWPTEVPPGEGGGAAGVLPAAERHPGGAVQERRGKEDGFPAIWMEFMALLMPEQIIYYSTNRLLTCRAAQAGLKVNVYGLKNIWICFVAFVFVAWN